MNRFLRDSLLQALMVFAWGCVLGLACIFTAAERINEGFLRFSVVMSFCALLGSAVYSETGEKNFVCVICVVVPPLVVRLIFILSEMTK